MNIIGTAVRRRMRELRRVLQGPQLIAFVPAIALAAFWVFGELALLGVALGLPMLLSGMGLFSMSDSGHHGRACEVTTLDKLEPVATRLAQRAQEQNKLTACFLLGFEDTEELDSRHGAETVFKLRDAATGRIRSALRPGDDIYIVDKTRIAVLLGPVIRLDLESALQIASRIQAAAEEPVVVAGSAIYPSYSVGLSLSSRLETEAQGKDFLSSANAALEDAQSSGASAIRAWSRHGRYMKTAETPLETEVRAALEAGEIVPWFQPQISTETGQVTGVEALARWLHPDRGTLPPAVFLPAIASAGLLPKLAETILQETLEALQDWDSLGFTVASAAVNMTKQDLDDPKLPDRIAWQLDRFNLTPDRLCIEVLEDVVAEGPDDVTARNIRALAAMGCGIDLDDFGTGKASISALRRFDVSRLKIDRSFVTRVDTDEDQRRVVAAVIGMAERLGLDTVAEGVETVGEHALLAQLGCKVVQGFGIARPMSPERIPKWIQTYNAKLAQAPRLPRAMG